MHLKAEIDRLTHALVELITHSVIWLPVKLAMADAFLITLP
jgi:hypothetical protein